MRLLSLIEKFYKLRRTYRKKKFSTTPMDGFRRKPFIGAVASGDEKGVNPPFIFLQGKKIIFGQYIYIYKAVLPSENRKSLDTARFEGDLGGKSCGSFLAIL